VFAATACGLAPLDLAGKRCATDVDCAGDERLLCRAGVCVADVDAGEGEGDAGEGEGEGDVGEGEGDVGEGEGEGEGDVGEGEGDVGEGEGDVGEGEGDVGEGEGEGQGGEGEGEPPPPDGDRDGVADVDDDCVNVANPDQADEDDDGFGDACDNCPDRRNADQADLGEVNEGLVPDGVGDVCDPNPTVDGDVLLHFEGFNAPLSSAWTTVQGSWTVSRGKLGSPSPSALLRFDAFDMTATPWSVDALFELKSRPTTRTHLAVGSQGTRPEFFMCAMRLEQAPADPTATFGGTVELLGIDGNGAVQNAAPNPPTVQGAQVGGLTGGRQFLDGNLVGCAGRTADLAPDNAAGRPMLWMQNDIAFVHAFSLYWRPGG
jgi:hypothetical protein